MNNFDYPWGADNSDAPWNHGDEPMKECPACDGYGKRECEYCDETPVNHYTDCEECCGTQSRKMICPECEGTGEVPMTDEDIQDEKDYYADMRMDEERLND